MAFESWGGGLPPPFTYAPDLISNVKTKLEIFQIFVAEYISELYRPLSTFYPNSSAHTSEIAWPHFAVRWWSKAGSSRRLSESFG